MTNQKNFDKSRYCETCPACGAAARSEQFYWDLNESALYYFCVNPKCINFDAVILREEVEAEIRKSKAWRRYRDRLWRNAIAGQKTQRRKVWESLSIH